MPPPDVRDATISQIHVERGKGGPRSLPIRVYVRGPRESGWADFDEKGAPLGAQGR